MARRLSPNGAGGDQLVLFATSCLGQLETIRPTPLPTLEPLTRPHRATPITPAVLPSATPTERAISPTAPAH